MSSLSKAYIQPTLDLFQLLGKSKEENVFYSPFSIISALSMLFLGTRENTAQQIAKVLHLQEDTENTKDTASTHHVERSENVHLQFQKLLNELNKPTDAYELKIANKFYGEKTFPFLQEYLDDINKYYLANAESVDFANAAEESQKKINSWVESQTNGKIKNLFPSGTLNSTTILVLVNAIYFKGEWDEKFNKEKTKEDKFWLNKNTSKPVQMMKQRNHFNFALLEDVQAKILEIPYKGKDLSMIVLLPNEIDGLQKLEEQLTAEKLIKWMSSQNMKKTYVKLHLPKFKIEEKYELSSVLEAMGVVDAFSPQNANLSGMSEHQGLVVSKVLHKSFVELAEEGTEAAAATGMVIRVTSAQMHEEFFCDHPFLFLIKQNKTNSILFFGRFSSP
ncbi:serpin B4 [Oryctolagus cuniculus]|uniref:serpin B4 n=1 Tax=Oryctolagus cuniculus TaxID=9986 RepID=UPI002232974D|nr:serpin B4 [Oryctolagus cuniculus]XP_051707103.1 serpin B4 [Oryctolagus cuniculus]